MGVLMLEVAGRRFDGGANGDSWIGRNGLEGWWDGPETQYDDDANPDGDGASDPVQVIVGPKRVNVSLTVDASSPQWASQNVRPWAAALAKRNDLEFSVFEEGVGWLSLRRAKVRGVPKVGPNRHDMRLTEIAFTAWSADPRKYGPRKRVSIDADADTHGGLVHPLSRAAGLDYGTTGDASFPGVFTIPNRGTAEFYPIFSIRGPVASFTIASEAHTIQYAAPVGRNQTLVLSPYAGGRAVLDGTDVSHNLTRADWVPVHGNETRGYLFTPVNPGGGSQLIIEYPDGAYW